MTSPLSFGETELPAEQALALRRAQRLQVAGLVYLVTCVGVVFAVMGSSQAMKAAWVEDLLSLVPPIAFLVAVRYARRPTNAEHPYGFHRAVGSGHLAAAVALLGMGAFLAVDSASGLLSGEHPAIGTVRLFGQTVWAGWPMIVAMVYTGVGPVIIGRLKMPLAEQLHDKVLYADAEMNKADWMTAGGAILGVVGIGVGWWWADAVAALGIAASVIQDGLTQVRNATRGLMDARARTFDDARLHPLIQRVEAYARSLDWVADAAARVRDEGHVFHTEVFVVPRYGHLTVRQAEDLRSGVVALDWKLQDVTVVPASEVPDALRRKPEKGR